MCDKTPKYLLAPTATYLKWPSSNHRPRYCGHHPCSVHCLGPSSPLSSEQPPSQVDCSLSITFATRIRLQPNRHDLRLYKDSIFLQAEHRACPKPRIQKKNAIATLVLSHESSELEASFENIEFASHLARVLQTQKVACVTYCFFAN